MNRGKPRYLDPLLVGRFQNDWFEATTTHGHNVPISQQVTAFAQKSLSSGTDALFVGVKPPAMLIVKGNMIALFILVFSTFALARFAVAQWRAIWITAANQPLSDEFRLATGIGEGTVAVQDFGTLIRLCNKLSPDLYKQCAWLKEVSTYYRILARMERLFSLNLPSVANWAKNEMQICSRYIAVVLGQSLSLQLDRQLAVRSQS